MLRTAPTRALVPRFLFGKGVLAWQCSLCCKMFTLTLEEAERLPSVEPPQYIADAFHLHDCQLVLELLAERVQQQSR